MNDSMFSYVSENQESYDVPEIAYRVGHITHDEYKMFKKLELDHNPNRMRKLK